MITIRLRHPNNHIMIVCKKFEKLQKYVNGIEKTDTNHIKLTDCSIYFNEQFDHSKDFYYVREEDVVLIGSDEHDESLEGEIKGEKYV